MPLASHVHGSAVSRRQLLKTLSFSGAGLSLPMILRSRAAAGATRTRGTSVIFIMLGGGATQFETYDPKPDAPSEYRGATKAISTSVPGVFISELLPEHARIMDKLALVRSVAHQRASHIAMHIIETGYDLRDPKNALRGEMPSVGSIVSRLRGSRSAEIPAFFSLPKAGAYSSPLYLGRKYDAFNINSDPNRQDFRVGNLSLAASLTAERLADRKSLWARFNGPSRLDDLDGNGRAVDAFTEQAFDILIGERSRRALDLNQEDARLRDRYGRNAFGQRLLLARRLVEAEVPFVMVRTFDWDDHDQLERRMRQRTPEYDRGVTALIEDLHARGLQRDVLVVAMGEFGRTPRVNAKGGRDHWPGVMSVLLSGGSLGMGQVVGASDPKGAAPVAARYRPENVLATMYRHLGIDPATTFPDLTGRPRYILEERAPISELL